MTSFFLSLSVSVLHLLDAVDDFSTCLNDIVFGHLIPLHIFLCPFQ